MRVEVKPDLLRWACTRARRDLSEVTARFPMLPNWLTGEAQPTLKQLEKFAKAMHAPIGFLLLPVPPVEPLPLPDFRTMANARVRRPSPDLLDTIYVCQQRQEWFRDFARGAGEPARAFVGSASVEDDVEKTAAEIRRGLRLDLAARAAFPTWMEALRELLTQADALGVLVMVNGIVGSNTHRVLDPEEFRGFALADPLAPLIFINGADTKSAQMFTVAHELAHLWLGETGISNAIAAETPREESERWCNQVAAELLVPFDSIDEEYRRDAPLQSELTRLVRIYKVSTLVILRRMHDVGGLSRSELRAAYAAELKHLLAIPRGDGGNFYLTETVRVGKRFARALYESTLEGQTLHRDALQLLGFSKMSTFEVLGHHLGVI